MRCPHFLSWLFSFSLARPERLVFEKPKKGPEKLPLSPADQRNVLRKQVEKTRKGKEKEKKLVLHENYTDYLNLYQEFLKNNDEFKGRLEGIQFDSDDFKREFNKCVPKLVELDTNTELEDFGDLERFDLGDWERVFKASKANIQILMLVQQPKAAEQPTLSTPVQTQTSTELPPQTPEKNNLSEKVDILSRTVAERGLGYYQYLIEAQGRQNIDYVYLRDIKAKNPNAWGYVNNFTEISGSWPDLAFKKFDELYDQKEPLDKAVVSAFNELGWAVENYPDAIQKLTDEIIKKLQPKIALLLQECTLSDRFDLTELSPTIFVETQGTYEVGSLTTKMPNSQYTALKKQILPAELTDPQVVDDFYQIYFSKAPRKKINNIQDLTDQLRDHDLKSLKEFFTSGLDDQEIIRRLNLIIQLKNLYYLNDETEKLKFAFTKEFNESLKKLNSELDQYYQRSTSPKLIARSKP